MCLVRVRQPVLKRHHARPQPTTWTPTFIVGARVRWVGAPFPLGRLSANFDQITVGTLYNDATLYRRHVTSVYARTVFLRDVIVFGTDDGSGDWVLVYTYRPDTILSVLGRLGWPVDA